MEANRKRDVLLEYFEKGSHFHYNKNGLLPSDECYRPLGWCSSREADVFCHIMQPHLAGHKRGEAPVAYERMKHSWDVFCEKIENGKIKIG